MNVLIAFEESGTVREAFRKRGHNAWSCDLEPARDNSPYHLRMDAIEAIESCYWDLIIMHPVCTALTVSGNHAYAAGKPKHHLRLEAVKGIDKLWRAAIHHGVGVCMENPQGVIHTSLPHLPKPQYVQPFEFGHDASKKTGLTLHNLPDLTMTPANFVRPRMVCKKCKSCGSIDEMKKGCKFCGAEWGDLLPRWGNQTDSGQNRLTPSHTRARDRAKTYDGIADAMAEQWLSFGGCSHVGE